MIQGKKSKTKKEAVQSDDDEDEEAVRLPKKRERKLEGKKGTKSECLIA